MIKWLQGKKTYLAATLMALEALKHEKYAKSIGVSKFEPANASRLLGDFIENAQRPSEGTK